MADWYESHIDANIRELVRLLRNNGWNTNSSCGHEYEGLIIIDCYDEQSGEALGDGKSLVSMLWWLLWDNGYKNFSIEHKLSSVDSRIKGEHIVLKMR